MVVLSAEAFSLKCDVAVIRCNLGHLVQACQPVDGIPAQAQLSDQLASLPVDTSTTLLPSVKAVSLKGDLALAAPQGAL